MAKTLPLIIEDTYVRQDDQGRFSLNDLHQASVAAGENPRTHEPYEFLRRPDSQNLIREMETTENSRSFSPVAKVEGRNGGTFVSRELVYAYAMWISPAFHLKVIRTFDALATGRLALPGDRTATQVVGKSTGLPTAQLVALQAQGWKIIDRLKAETVRELRADLYEDLAKVFADMGKTAPPLDAIGQEAPDVAAEVAEFWTVFKALERLGHPVNHSRNPDLVALKLAQVQSLAHQEGLDVAPLKTLKRLLRSSRAPRFVEVKSVSSAHAGLTVHCWVFERREGGAA